jgi:hypothetical protein
VWALGAALALLVAWLGVRAVIQSTTGPMVPAVDGAPGPTAPSRAATPGPHGQVPPASAGPVSAGPVSTGPASTAPASAGPPASSTAPSSGPPAAGPAPSPAGPDDEHVYAMTGGRVTLQITNSKCTLVGATAEAGFAAENWSSLGWLRVDFNQDGVEASSLVCDWYQQSPTVTIGA